MYCVLAQHRGCSNSVIELVVSYILCISVMGTRIGYTVLGTYPLCLGMLQW